MHTLAHTTRASAIEVDVLDLRDVCQYVRTKYDSLPKLGSGWAWGRIGTHAGYYVVNTEGVGPAHPISNERPWVLSLYRYPQGVAFGAERQIRVSPFVLHALPVKERLPLTQFIRMVGPTLERNFLTWRKRLDDAGVAA